MRFYTAVIFSLGALFIGIQPLALAQERLDLSLNDYEYRWAGRRLPPVGYVDEKQVYVLMHGTNPPSTNALVISKFDPWTAPPRLVSSVPGFRFSFHQDVEETVWRLAYGIIWSGGGGNICRVPLEDGSLHGPGNLDRSKKSKQTKTRDGLPGGGRQAQSWLFNDFGKLVYDHYEKWFLSKWQSINLQHTGAVGIPGGLNPYTYHFIHMDLLPESGESALLFCCPIWPVLRGGQVVDAWSVRGRWNAKERRWRPADYSHAPLISIKLPFDELFRVFGDRKELFFVTQSGKLYSAFREPDGHYTLRQRWKGTMLPIVALIHDTKRQRTFAFTKSAIRRPNHRPVYFELRVPLKPVEYDFPDGDKVDGPTLAELAGLLFGKEIEVE